MSVVVVVFVSRESRLIFGRQGDVVDACAMHHGFRSNSMMR